MNRYRHFKKKMALLLRTLQRRWLDLALPQETTRHSLPGKYVLITGMGHCGTKWLSVVLHHPEDNMVCYHEMKARLTPGTWYEPLVHELEIGIDDYFDLYFRFIELSFR